MKPNDFRDLVGFTIAHFPVLEPYFYIVPPTLLTDEQWTAKVGQGMTPTACVTSTGMFFASSFLDSLSKPKRVGLILHEVLHLARQDMSQPWVDTTVPPKAFRVLANIAQDYCIERTIATMAGMVNPDGTVSTQVGGRSFEPNYPVEKWNAYPPNTPWRTVYEDLKGQGQRQQRRGGGGGVDAPGLDLPELAPLLERAHQESQRVLAQRRGTGGNTRGDIAVQWAPPTVPWQEVLRDHLTSIPNKVRRTWSKVKRRDFGAFNEYRASRIGSAMALGDVSLYVDTSGSMHATLDRVAGDIMNLLATLDVKRLTIVYYDVAVLHRVVVPAHEIGDFDLTHMPGGGGTAVLGAMVEEIAAPRYESRPVVVLTDGYDNYHIPPDVAAALGPVVWVSYDVPVGSNVGVSVTIPETIQGVRYV